MLITLINYNIDYERAPINAYVPIRNLSTIQQNLRVVE